MSDDILSTLDELSKSDKPRWHFMEALIEAWPAISARLRASEAVCKSFGDCWKGKNEDGWVEVNAIEMEVIEELWQRWRSLRPGHDCEGG